MESIWLNFGISAVLTLLQEVIKNPNKKAQYKKVMLKIARAIFAAYPTIQILKR